MTGGEFRRMTAIIDRRNAGRRSELVSYLAMRRKEGGGERNDLCMCRYILEREREGG